MSKLILIPHSTEGNSPVRAAFDLSAHTRLFLPSLDGLFAESLSGGRRFLKNMGLTLPLVVAGKDTLERQLQADLEAARGQTWAFVSDAGYPCLADPGASLVQKARQLGFDVDLLPGTSSIFAAIALSGLPAQRFAFHGYLPRAEEACTDALLDMEQGSRISCGNWQGFQLQIFIETPYRHATLMRRSLQTLDPSTWLCVASEIGNEGQCIRSHTIAQWRKLSPEPESLVAVYLLLGEKERSKPNPKQTSTSRESRCNSKILKKQQR